MCFGGKQFEEVWVCKGSISQAQNIKWAQKNN